MMSEQQGGTAAHDLPLNVLDFIFGRCDRSAVASLPCVCRSWRQMFASCSAPLPPLKLTSPLPAPSWLELCSRRLVQLTLKRVTDISSLACLQHLQSLRLEDCPRLESLAVLRQLACLRQVSLYACRSLTDLSPLAALPQLAELHLDRCSADISCLSGHPSCAELHLGFDMWAVVWLQFPTELPALKRLRIMAAIQDLSPVARFTSLTQLDIDAVAVCDLTPLTALHDLQELNLFTLQDETLGLDMMSPLSGLQKLQSLGLQGSDAAIAELTPWRALAPSLTRVDLHGSYVSDLAPLSCLGRLRELDLAQARQLQDLRPLAGLSELTALDLTGCKGVRDLRPVLHLKASGGLRKPGVC